MFPLLHGLLGSSNPHLSKFINPHRHLPVVSALFINPHTHLPVVSALFINPHTLTGGLSPVYKPTHSLTGGLSPVYKPTHTDRWSESYSVHPLSCFYFLFLSSLQFNRSVVSDSLRPHRLQHPRLPRPSPTPGACSNSRPLSE